MLSGKGGKKKKEVNTMKKKSLQCKRPPIAEGMEAPISEADPNGAAHSLLALTCTPV